MTQFDVIALGVYSLIGWVQLVGEDQESDDLMSQSWPLVGPCTCVISRQVLWQNSSFTSVWPIRSDTL